MRPSFPLSKSNHTSTSVSDLHRKLASILNQLRGESSDDCDRFLSGKISVEYDDRMFEAINTFKRTFGLKPDDDGICDEKTWDMLNVKAGSVFTEVWQYELDALKLRRLEAAAAAVQKAVQAEQPEIVAAREDAMMAAKHAPGRNRRRSTDPVETLKNGNTGPLKVTPADEDDVVATAHASQLAGLAFSGGGVRSATFNLGILQALAERKMLGNFDYLSTVSGGGYIGSWFSAWLKREHGNLDTVADALSPGTSAKPVRQEREEIRFLRQYSNYLTPRPGLFSADTWALLATYFRNTVLNLTILAALLGAVLILPRLLGILAGTVGAAHPVAFAWIGAVIVLWAVFYIALSISSMPNPASHQWRRGQSQQSILFLVVLPLMVSAFASSVAIWHYRQQFADIWNRIPPTTAHPVLTWVVAPGVAYFGAWGAGWFCAQFRNRRRNPNGIDKWQSWREAFGHFFCAVVALAVGVVMLTWSVSTLNHWTLATATLDGPARGMLLVSYGMPFILTIFGLSMILAVGMIGRMYHDKSREWWSRQGGWTSICTLAWFAVTAVALYSAPIMGYLYANLHGWIQALIGSAWLGTTLAGLKLGQSSATGKRGARPYLEWIAALAPLLFSVGALFIISTVVYFMMTRSVVATGWGGPGYMAWSDAFNNYFATAELITAKRAAIVMGCLLVVGLALARRVDVNKFSLSMMYRNRLVRAYLGASNAERNPNPFTGFDERDDLHLASLLGNAGIIQRPYPIINTALNLVNGKELAWQTRKAAGFAFTPAFCGFELPSMAAAGSAQAKHEAERGCFRPTAGYGEDERAKGDEEGSVKLGMAVSVSGAAVSPNMGYHSSPALSFLMTLFNVRLGRWFANPRRNSWARSAPKFGIRYLIAELFGLSDADARFVYLSDGGHFENLGIYELVRRRCRLIVVIDASADGQLDFEDLGNAIRKCATDLHIEINIDARQIVPKQPDEFSKAHCVVGDILYKCTDENAENGTLLYVKPSLIDSEYAEILNYHKAHRDFPHQSTADQWFDETQFESYRSLGYRIGMRVFVQPPPPFGTTKAGAVAVPSVPALAAALRKKWGSQDGTPVPVELTPSPAKEDARPAAQPVPSGTDDKAKKVDEPG